MQKGLVSETKAEQAKEESSDEENVVCLVAGVSSYTWPPPSWVSDSGATSHMCHDKNLFSELSEIAPLSITMGDDSDVHAKGKGVCWCKINVSGSVRKCNLDAVLHVPGLKYNFLSVVRITKYGCKVLFEGTRCEIYRNGKHIAEGSLHVMHDYMSTTSRPTDIISAFIADFNLWHERLGHVHVDEIKYMVRNQVVRGMKVDSSKAVQKYEPCIFGKTTRASDLYQKKMKNIPPKCCSLCTVTFVLCRKSHLAGQNILSLLLKIFPNTVGCTL